jgi:acyl-CoA synthetase (AMP-forming)/AMP-acid ligase II
MEAKLLQELLVRGAEAHPERPLVWTKKSWHSYGEVGRLAGRVAAFLREDQGLAPGDRVVFILENSVEYIAWYYGTLWAGGVAVAVNHSTVAGEIATVLADCRPRLVVAQRSVFKHLAGALAQAPSSLESVVTLGGALPQEMAAGRTVVRAQDVLQQDRPAPSGDPRGTDELCSIVYTSGTTGQPKGVMLSHRNLLANAASIVEYLLLTASDRVMCVLPFFFSYGNSLLTTHLMVGGSLVLHNGFVFPNVILDEMVSEACTGFAGVPSTFALLLHRSKFKQLEFPALRYVTIAGGGLPAPAQAELQQVIPRAQVFNMYGQTEGAARLSHLPPQYFDSKLGSIGRGIPGVELRVVTPEGSPVNPGDTGEIIACGPNIMMGYWESPEETQAVLRDGWLWTGDLARVDEEGFIFIVSRKKDIIKSGAFRIGPNAIESALIEHPGLAEVSVVGAPDKLMGEAIVAYVVLKDDTNVTERDLTAHCHERLPPYKVPKRYEFVDSLPKTTSGKVQKHVLRAQEEEKARLAGDLS